MVARVWVPRTLRRGQGLTESLAEGLPAPTSPLAAYRIGGLPGASFLTEELIVVTCPACTGSSRPVPTWCESSVRVGCLAVPEILVVAEVPWPALFCQVLCPELTDLGTSSASIEGSNPGSANRAGARARPGRYRRRAAIREDPARRERGRPAPGP